MTDVIKRSRLKREVFPRYLLRTAEPTVRGFYEIFKSRFPLYMTAEQDVQINEFVDSGYAKSQNDFINKAIDFYIGHMKNSGYDRPHRHNMKI